MISSLMYGTSSFTCSGVSSSDGSPQEIDEVMRRLNSSSRSGLRATSIPPLTVCTPSSMYWFVESRVSAVISFEWSTGKMKLDACPVEPPGLGSAPLSSRTRSRQPRRAR
jgi:hypothetical protein